MSCDQSQKRGLWLHFLYLIPMVFAFLFHIKIASFYAKLGHVMGSWALQFTATKLTPTMADCPICKVWITSSFSSEEIARSVINETANLRLHEISVAQLRVDVESVKVRYVCHQTIWKYWPRLVPPFGVWGREQEYLERLSRWSFACISGFGHAHEPEGEQNCAY